MMGSREDRRSASLSPVTTTRPAVPASHPAPPAPETGARAESKARLCATSSTPAPATTNSATPAQEVTSPSTAITSSATTEAGEPRHRAVCRGLSDASSGARTPAPTALPPVRGAAPATAPASAQASLYTLPGRTACGVNSGGTPASVAPASHASSSPRGDNTAKQGLDNTTNPLPVQLTKPRAAPAAVASPSTSTSGNTSVQQQDDDGDDAAARAYAKSIHIPELFNDLAGDILHARPADMVEFMLEWLKVRRRELGEE